MNLMDQTKQHDINVILKQGRTKCQFAVGGIVIPRGGNINKKFMRALENKCKSILIMQSYNVIGAWQKC